MADVAVNGLASVQLFVAPAVTLLLEAFPAHPARVEAFRAVRGHVQL